MEINFNFLKSSSTFKDFYPAANKVHKLYTIEDYRDVISNSRRLLETITKKIFKLENLNQYYSLPTGEYHNLRNDTHYLRMNLDYPVSIMNLFDEIRRMGNAAIHDSQIEPDKKQAWRCICDLHDILIFLINSYDGQKLYYLRPDISMESADFPMRKNESQPHIKLNDHCTKKQANQHAKKKVKKVVHFSSKNSPTKVKPTSKTIPTKSSWLNKIKNIFSSNKHQKRR